ncbi:hypothetical protein FA13DRAFT_1723944, partial [Coprinellus micaceus]
MLETCMVARSRIWPEFDSSSIGSGHALGHGAWSFSVPHGEAYAKKGVSRVLSDDWRSGVLYSVSEGRGEPYAESENGV